MYSALLKITKIKNYYVKILVSIVSAIEPSYDYKDQNQSKCLYTCQGISGALKSQTLSNLTCIVSTFTDYNESTVFDR